MAAGDPSGSVHEWTPLTAEQQAPMSADGTASTERRGRHRVVKRREFITPLGGAAWVEL